MSVYLRAKFEVYSSTSKRTPKKPTQIRTKFQLENIKWDKILPDNSPDKAYDKVTPIFKSGKNKLLTNYRPISVLLCFSKILERIMYKRLSEYLTKNYLLFDKQLNLERVI